MKFYCLKILKKWSPVMKSKSSRNEIPLWPRGEYGCSVLRKINSSNRVRSYQLKIASRSASGQQYAALSCRRWLPVRHHQRSKKKITPSAHHGRWRRLAVSYRSFLTAMLMFTIIASIPISRTFSAFILLKAHHLLILLIIVLYRINQLISSKVHL